MSCNSIFSPRKERDLVVLDEVSGFVVSEKQKQVARIAAQTNQSRPKKPKSELFWGTVYGMVEKLKRTL